MLDFKKLGRDIYLWNEKVFLFIIEQERETVFFSTDTYGGLTLPAINIGIKNKETLNLDTLNKLFSDLFPQEVKVEEKASDI